jgi:alanyl-tRNA synthetase
VKSDDLRSLFLKFFEEKGHKVVSSSSLIPRDDPTLLLTNAGMVQIKPYFLGEATPPSRRLASCQKCFRTSDIESVGDATHLTFFEMLGNFSVGDYFKKEAIAWAWEFVTERIKIPPEKLWATIYLDDDESFKYWREIGVPESKIARFGDQDNFWGPAGSSGPCGPCSEIHYDFGPEHGCGRPDCKPNCACGRFTELWNLVFTQYNQDEKGNRMPLPKPNIDTGMGLERLLTITTGQASIYDTDIFAPQLKHLAKITGRKYGENPDDDNAMRVVAEHGRAMTFLIADGVLPDNEGRGYVLRRLLRRAALFGRRLGLDKPFLSELAETTVRQMSHLYPELKHRRESLTKTIKLEETRFNETLGTGLAIIDNILSKAAVIKAGQISGADAFKLYDTYGFPVDLTKEIVAKSGFSVDTDGFEKEMEKQRERARATHKFDISAGAAGVKKLDVAATNFVGYTCLEQNAKVVKLLVDGKEVDTIAAGQSAGIVLDVTPFYAEMGGQVGDTGEIVGLTGKFSVTATVRLQSDIIVHQGRLTEGFIEVGDQVEAFVDVERRRDIARNHTATHLLQAALRQVLGTHIQQRGSLVAPDRLRFDFSHLAAMTPEEIKSVQRIVNERVRQNIKVYDEETDYKKAVDSGAIALFDEKYGDVVRVMRIGDPSAPPVSTELCGGTHVSYTGEIGYFHILGEGSIGAGLRRIEAVTGRKAEEFIEKSIGNLNEAARILETQSDSIMDKMRAYTSELEKTRKYALGLERMLASHEIEAALHHVNNIKGINLIADQVSSGNQLVMREMIDALRNRLSSAIIVLGAISGDRPVFIAAVTSDLVARGYNAGIIVKRVSEFAGGGGGGRADFAQGSGSEKNKLKKALNLAKDLI